MLVLTKKYELIEVNVLKAFFMVLIPVVLIAAIAGYFTSIPDNINLALSVVLGILGTVIWELIREKRRKIFDEEGIELILTNINIDNEVYVKKVIADFFKTLDNNKLIFKLNKSNILEEMELLFSFIQSSFPELKVKLREVKRIEELFNKITASPSVLTTDYKVDFNNLAFLYEMNNHYMYHNYSIGKLANLKYTLINKDLLLQRSFVTELLVNDDLFFNEKYKDHPLKSEYFELLHKLLYLHIDGHENTAFLKNYFRSFIELFYKTIKDKNLQTLAILLAYDLLLMRNAFLNDDQLSEDEVGISKKEADETFRLCEEYIVKHEIFYFIFSSTYESYNVFTDNFSQYEFSPMYKYLIKQIYSNQLNNLIKKHDANNFIAVYKDWLTTFNDNDYKSLYTQLYEQFYEYYSFKKLIDLNKLNFKRDSDNDELENWYEAEFNFQIKNLSLLADNNEELTKNVLKTVFFQRWTVDFFKSIPLYHFQPLKNFAEYLRN